MKTLGNFYEITYIDNEGKLVDLVPCLKRKDAIIRVNELETRGYKAWYTERAIWK